MVAEVATNLTSLASTPKASKRRAHFRVLPTQTSYNPKQHFDNQENHRWNTVKESTEHRLAKELITAEISRRLNYGLGMPWRFKDKDVSNFPFLGNLLLGADRVVRLCCTKI